MPQPTYTVEELVEQDLSADFDAFGHEDAWQVGQYLLELAREQELAIATAIWLGDQRVFHLGMAGTSADNDHWLERKAALVRRYNASSWLTT